MSTSKAIHSPMKFLDSYQKEDAAIFFGRAEETENLARLISRYRQVILYGSAGVGKTSLVQAGLLNRIDERNLFPIFIRIQGNLGQSLDAALRNFGVYDSGENYINILAKIYDHHLRPILLVFDQIEELFLFGGRADQEVLVRFLDELQHSNARCKVLLVIREEYIGEFYGLTQQFPELLDNRLRLEQMTNYQIRDVVIKSCMVWNIQIEETFIEDLMERIYTGSEINLTILQVYLESLYKTAVLISGEELPVFNLSLLQRVGDIGSVISEFLDTQIAQVNEELRIAHPQLPENLSFNLLQSMVSLEGTPIIVSLDYLYDLFPETNPEVIDSCLNSLIFRRLIRSTDTDRFQLSSSQLAILVDQRRSQEERILRLVLQDLYRDYNRYLETGYLLPINSLNLISDNWAQIEGRVSNDLGVFIEKSRRRIKKRRIWQRLITVLVFIIIVVNLALLGNPSFSLIRSLSIIVLGLLFVLFVWRRNTNTSRSV